MKMNQSKENRNGCKEQTEKEKNVMESIMNEFSEYICDHLCKYPEQSRTRKNWKNTVQSIANTGDFTVQY